MGETTAISWCDHTHNHWVGCQRVSPACDGCYAAHLMDTRLHRVSFGGPGKGAGTRALTSYENRRKPIGWNRKAAAAGTRPFVFCSSLADVFDNHVDPDWRLDLFDLIHETPRLVWLLLTKRPQLIPAMVEKAGGLPPNVALGTTAEDQTRWNLNVPALLEAKAELAPLFAFVSVEPMLGPIDPRKAPLTMAMRRHPAFATRRSSDTHFDPLHPRQDPRFRLDWIITGGETDQGAHKARPSHPQWFRDIRDACVDTGTAYHHKQNGEWAVASHENGHFDSDMSRNDAVWLHSDGITTKPSSFRVELDTPRDPVAVFRIGKKRSGRLLDGVEHNDRPEVAA